MIAAKRCAYLREEKIARKNSGRCYNSVQPVWLRAGMREEFRGAEASQGGGHATVH